MIDIEKLKDIIQSYCAACDTESIEYNEGFQACGMMILKEVEKLSKIQSVSKESKEEPTCAGIYSEAYDTEVWEWLKQHGSEETMRVIMMTASHFAQWQKEKMMENAIDGMLGFVSIILGKPNYDRAEVGKLVKVIIIKDE